MAQERKICCLQLREANVEIRININPSISPNKRQKLPPAMFAHVAKMFLVTLRKKGMYTSACHLISISYHKIENWQLYFQNEKCLLTENRDAQ